MKRFVRTAAVVAKRLIRPLIPDAIMVKLRRGEPQPALRYNLDIVVAGATDQRRWLHGTPREMRVRSPRSFGESFPSAPIHRAGSPMPHLDPAIVAISTRRLTLEQSDALFTPLADPAIDGSILAAAETPVIVRGTPPLPHFDPVALAFRREAFDEIGPAPAGRNPLPGLFERSLAAGHRLAAVPVTPTTIPRPRRDPIRGLGSVVILAVVPLHDIGGGSRSAQMALELAARGYHVTYVSVFPVDETVDLGLRFVHPNLEASTIDRWKPGDLLPRVESRTRLAIVELPHPRLLAPIAELAEAGYEVVYDLIDDWSDAELGWWGFNPDVERKTIALAHGLVGSAASLVRRLETVSGREASLVPNAVNARLFSPGNRPLPDDVPEGDGPIFEYHGSLYGDWFDWKSLVAVAEASRDARILVIGDEKQHPPLPDNVHFLGLKPQYELPAYLDHTDLGIIPFLVTEATHAVSPLKAFEYLAMGVPVAAPPLEPLQNLPGIYTDTDLPSAVRAALHGDPPDAQTARRVYGWSERLGRLFRTVGLDLAEDPDAGPVLAVRRPVVRYSDAERLMS